MCVQQPRARGIYGCIPDGTVTMAWLIYASPPLVLSGVVRKEVEGKDTSGVRRNQMDEIDQAAISIADLGWPVPEKAGGDTHGERAGRKWPKEITRLGLASELRVVS